MSRPFFLLLPAALLLPSALLLQTACTETRVSLGQAYVAPTTLHVRSELSIKSTNVAELKHGDKLEIVDIQRRMVRVRTAKGVEGWVDSAQLLSPDQMDALKKRRQLEAALPSEGSATTYEVLNMHIDPDRQSPAFAQIPEGGSVTILGHKVEPKVNLAPRPPGMSFPKPQVLSRKQRKEQQTRIASLRLPPKPPPPKPPANWLELSAERIDGAIDQEPAPAPKLNPAKTQPAKPVVLEDWTLVRSKHNELGWVLSRNLLVSIPDEVAQYAEGKQITAFFDLGQVNDDLKGLKHHWLWTTAARALPFDFDSWRVFLWNTHHHRYETSYRQHDLEGYFPVHVEPSNGSTLRTFSLITKDDDGRVRQRTYSFDGHLVHLTRTEDYRLANSANPNPSALNASQLTSKTKPGWFNRQWSAIKQALSGK
jgi:hypothetical protein